MKKLSDYKGEDAIELWADLLEPLSVVFTNEEVKSTYSSKASALMKAKAIIKNCKTEAIQILERIDPTPVDGLNVIIRLVEILLELENDETLRGFFGSAVVGQMSTESSGYATENTVGGES